MIIQTKNGTKVTGTISRTPEIKESKVGKPFLSLSIKAQSTKDESGNRSNIFVECCIWHDLDRWDGLLQKGDFVEVCGGELKSNTGANGKIYWNLQNVEGVVVGGLVTARWVQMAIDAAAEMIMRPTMPSGTDFYHPDGPAPVEGEEQPESGKEPPTNAPAPVPDKQPAQTAVPDYDDDSRVIDDDADDLPF